MAQQILLLQGSLEAIESDKEGEDIMQRISWQQQEIVMRKQRLMQSKKDKQARVVAAAVVGNLDNNNGSGKIQEDDMEY